MRLATFAAEPWLGTTSSAMVADRGWIGWLIVGGSNSLLRVRMEKAASTAPAAVRVWPIIDLLELIGIRPARSPNSCWMPKASILSFSGVPVPWALM